MIDRRKEAWNYIKSMVEQGFNATSIISFLREHGLSYRRTDMLADIRNAQQRPTYRNLLKFVPENKRPSERLVVETPEALSSKYRMLFETEMYDFIRGRVEKKILSVNLDEITTIGEAKQKLINTFKDLYKEAGYEIRRLVPYQLEKRMGE